MKLTRAQRETNKAIRAENLEAGFCACGDEERWECECFGTYQLALQQGLIAPTPAGRTALQAQEEER